MLAIVADINIIFHYTNYSQEVTFAERRNVQNTFKQLVGWQITSLHRR